MVHGTTLEEYLTTPEELSAYEKRQEELKVSHYNKRSPFCVEFYTSRGFTVQEADVEIEKIKDKAKVSSQNHCSQPAFYIAKGFDTKTAEQMACDFRKRIGSVPTRQRLIEKWGDAIGNTKWEEYQNTLSKRVDKFLDKFTDRREALIMQCINRGYGNNKVCKLSLTDFEIYANHCRYLTRLVLCAYRDVIDPTGLNLGRDYGRNGFHLDHKFSIYGGFYHKVDPMKICSVENFRLIDAKENIQKSQFCIISLEEILSYKTILDEDWLSEECKERIRNVYCKAN